MRQAKMRGEYQIGLSAKMSSEQGDRIENESYFIILAGQSFAKEVILSVGWAAGKRRSQGGVLGGRQGRALWAMERISDFVLIWEPLGSFRLERANAMISPGLIGALQRSFLLPAYCVMLTGVQRENR